jgi:2-C-methyl-D-erythritol 4-phosphate cytidylyltransferase
MDWADLLKTLITAVTSVIVALVTAGYFRKNQDKKKEKKSREKLVEQIQRDELIHFTLKELRRKYITDRVYIIQFHNGGTFYTQTPMQKASVTYERCSDGLERIISKYFGIKLQLVFN